MAFLVFMIILHLYSDHCFGQHSMNYDAGMKCTKCIVGTKAGAALPLFDRDGKGGDTCFFCLFKKFL